jgi:hypothetical protein
LVLCIIQIVELLTSSLGVYVKDSGRHTLLRGMDQQRQTQQLSSQIRGGNEILIAA